jgi:hypothetical protein
LLFENISVSGERERERGIWQFVLCFGDFFSVESFVGVVACCLLPLHCRIVSTKRSKRKEELEKCEDERKIGRK